MVLWLAHPLFSPLIPTPPLPCQLVDYVDEFGRRRQVKRRDLPSVQALDTQPPPPPLSTQPRPAPRWQVRLLVGLAACQCAVKPLSFLLLSKRSAVCSLSRPTHAPSSRQSRRGRPMPSRSPGRAAASMSPPLLRQRCSRQTCVARQSDKRGRRTPRRCGMTGGWLTRPAQPPA